MKIIGATPLLAVVILGGCASGRTAAQPPATIPQASQDVWKTFAAKLPIGSTVNVGTTDGRRLTAVLLVVDRDEIIVKPKTRIPEPEQHVRFDRLERLELKRESQGGYGKAVAIGAGAGGAGFLVLLLLALASWD